MTKGGGEEEDKPGRTIFSKQQRKGEEGITSEGEGQRFRKKGDLLVLRKSSSLTPDKGIYCLERGRRSEGSFDDRWKEVGLTSAAERKSLPKSEE